MRSFLVALIMLGSMQSLVCAEDSRLERFVTELQSFDTKVRTLAVDCKSTGKFEFYGPGGSRPKPGIIQDDAIGQRTSTAAKWLFRRNSDWRLEAEISGKTVLADSVRRDTSSVLISVYDGDKKKGKYAFVGSGEPQEIESDSLVLYNEMLRPTEVLTQYLKLPIARHLERGKIVREEKLGDRRVVVARTKTEVVRANYHSYHEFWLDMQKGVVVRRKTFLRRGEKSVWGLHLQTDCENFVRDPGSRVWLPTIVKTFNWIVTDAGQGKLSTAGHYVFKDWKINAEIPERMFSLDEPLAVSRIETEHQP